jgi:DNA repair exonuclease SbcCD nuclease subunit
MTTIRLIGDIHLGKRFPHTTLKTADRFDGLRDTQVAKSLSLQSCIQLGDLFDTYTVPDNIFVNGYKVTWGCLWTLAGNHDLSKNTDKPSALALLRDNLNDAVALEPTRFTEGMTEFFLVPHQFTQDKFIGVLEGLLTPKQQRFNVLCLHCNFGDHTGAETDNYLPPELAKRLMSSGFTLIVSGHEHNHRKPIPGVVMLGSILPMSFGEMETKFVMDYDTQGGTYELVPTWVSDKYAKIDAQGYLEHDFPSDTQFIEVVGDVDVDTMAQVNRRTQGMFKNMDSLIAIKNNTVLHRHSKAAKDTKKEYWLDALLRQCVNDRQRDLLRGWADARN